MSSRSIAKLALAVAATAALASAPARAVTPDDILKASTPAEWRRIDPKHLLYLDIESGRVVIELAPGFAPNHVSNIEALVKAGYFDNAFIVRSQDNYVVQWSQPDTKKPLGEGRPTLKAEFDRPIDPAVPFDVLPDPDTYAPEVGFAWGMPAARDPALGRMWLAHCYGMVGAGRDNGADSGGGTELYAVNGQSPRQLDRNVTLVGRVIVGMELLSSLPRGADAMGFYKNPQDRIPIARIRLAADVPDAERVDYEALKTDSASFKALVESRRNRKDDWYKVPAGRIGLCNAPLPVRAVAR
jgi:cyclophilin family peptidyl-prolyl cis-trans isomerase